MKVLAPKELAAQVEQTPGIEVKSRREVPDEVLQLGAKEVIDILAFLTTSLEVVKLSLEMLRWMKKSGRKDQKAILQSPRGGASVEIYEYEEEVVVQRKVERVFVQRD